MSPILVRPVREQLEHDRVVRALQVKLRRRGIVAVNAGDERITPLKVGRVVVYPDLVITGADGGRKLAGVVEVETGESVNHLEAMSQWVPMGKARARFSLYVPVGTSDGARRLCTEHGVKVDEIWTFHTLGEQIRLSQVYRAPADRPAAAKSKPSAARSSRKAKRPGSRARAAAPARAAKSARRGASKGASRSAKPPAGRRRARGLRRK